MISLLALLASSPAFALDEPCYGFAYPDTERLEGDHFWVEWELNVGTLADAEERLLAAEEARQAYIDLGWDFVDDPITLRILTSDIGGSYGRAETIDCTDHASPVVFLFTDNNFIPGRSTTMHEVAHTVQYAYMGAYLDSVTSWIWWMEGSASWLTSQADGNPTGFTGDARDYVQWSHLALHHRVSAFLIPEQSDHMYGTSMLTHFIQQYYGGSDAVRSTWEYGATVTGDVIYFPDAINGAGMDFEELWPHYMARMATMDMEFGNVIGLAPRAGSAQAYPADGDSPEDKQVEGLGLSFVEFDAGFEEEMALQISFDGDPAVDWYVVLATSEASAAGSPILQYVTLDVDDSGRAEGWISDYQRIQGHLIVSPKTIENTGYDYSWSAGLIEDPGPMADVVTLSERQFEATGCGCASPLGGHYAWSWLVVGLVAMRRRR